LGSILGAFGVHFGDFWVPLGDLVGYVKMCTPPVRKPYF